MPMYDFECEQGHRFERMVKLKDFEEVQQCACLTPAKRLISMPMFSVEQVGYSCPITEKWVSSGREHRENLRQHGCRVFEPGEKEAAATFRRKADEAFDKKVEDTVEREIEAMPSAKKEKLYAEMTRGGADVEIVRGAV